MSKCNDVDVKFNDPEVPPPVKLAVIVVVDPPGCLRRKYLVVAPDKSTAVALSLIVIVKTVPISLLCISLALKIFTPRLSNVTINPQ